MSVAEAEFTVEEMDTFEQQIVSAQQKSLAEKLGQDAKLCSLLSQLVERNPNIALDMNFFMGRCEFPHRRMKKGMVEREGTLLVSISLRDNSAGLYWPSSTNKIHVAEIYSWRKGLCVELHPLDTKYCREGEKFNRIIQRDLFTNVPRKLSGLDLTAVQDMFNQAITDITDVFQEYVN